MDLALPTRRRTALLFAAAALLLPSSAWACGVCSDAAMRRQAWAVSAAMALVVGLGTEAAAYAVALPASGRKSRYRRAPMLFAAGFAAVAVGFATGASGVFMAATFAVGLAVSFVRSLKADAGFGRRLIAGRVALATLLAVALFFRAHPTQVKTPRLVTLALIAPDSWGEGPHGWVEEQLVSRADARAEVEGRLGPLEKGPGPRAQDVELLRLHRLLGGDPAARAAACSRWGVTAEREPTIERWHDRPGPPDGLLSRLCARAK